jgi:energy-coupling factor transporter ATP-binding protein EcfA2
MSKVILISGQQGSGKTTLSNLLLKVFESEYIKLTPMKFADPLYAMHEALRGVCKEWDIPFGGKEGELLQFLGTEWGRNKRGADVWVNAVKSRIASAADSDPEATIVIDDCRFKNEFYAFPDALRVRLVAPESVRKVRADGWRENTRHISETDLDDLAGEFDLIIDTSTDNKLQVASKVIEAYNVKFATNVGKL